MKQILELGLEIELVVLDAGFYSVDVINYLPTSSLQYQRKGWNTSQF
ncbi:MAG: hypothetical protein QXV69_03555 [Sulfolobaceae archaeon]